MRAARWLGIAGLVAGMVAMPAAGTAYAQATVTGTVVDQGTDRPLSGVLIRMDTAAAGIITGRDGRFTLRDLAVGRYVILFELIGYAARTDTLNVFRPGAIEVRVPLTTRPLELSPIRVVGQPSSRLERAGFYTRRAAGYGGHFIDRDEVDRRRPEAVTDLLRDAPGVNLRRTDIGTMLIRFRRETGLDAHPDGCVPDLYLDGVLVSGPPGQSRMETHDIIDPRTIEGIEVYRGPAAPIEYSRSPCGAVLIWTRTGR